MRPASSKPFSSHFEEGEFDAERYSSSSPSTGGVEKIHKMKGKNRQGSSQAKRTRDESRENLKATRSRKSKKVLEELSEQTNPKEASSTAAAEEGARRSSRSKQRPVIPADSANKWSGNEDLSVARALLDTCSASGEVNYNLFYTRAKEELGKEMTNSQLYEKDRTMSRRFWSIQSTLQEQNIPEHSFAFRTPQEPALFQMWKQIWGKNNNVSSANGGQIARDGKFSEAENSRENKFVDKAEETEDERAAAEESTRDQGQHEEKKPPQGNLHGKSPDQTLAENAIKNSCFEGLIEGLYNRLQPSSGGGWPCSNLSRRMKELMGAVNAVEEFPGLSAAREKELQQKWRRHRIHELKMLSDLFELLRDQCNAFLENLEN